MCVNGVCTCVRCVRVSREWIMIMKIGDHNFTDATDAHVNAPRETRVEITVERNSHRLSHILTRSFYL